MAGGLLDFLNSDEARMGLGLLAAGGPSATPMNAFQRIQMAQQGMDTHNQGKLKSRLLESQIAENASQSMLGQAKVAAQAQKAAFDKQFMSGGLTGQAPAGGGAPGGSGAGGAVGAGGFTAQEIAQMSGVPLEAVIADYKFNGGKKIAEFISKRAEPNWINVNGNLVNTNAADFRGGQQGGVSAGQGGQVTQWAPDGRGGLVVGAPEGALDTFRAYQKASNRSAADFQSETVIDPVTKEKVLRPRSEVLQPQPLPARPFGTAPGYGTEAQMRTTAHGDMGGDPNAARREIAAMERDLATPGKVTDQASRQALTGQIAEMRRQLTNMGGSAGAPAPMIGPGAGRGDVSQAPAAGNVVEISPAEQAANKAAEARAVDTAKAGVVRDTEQQTKTKNAKEMLGDIKRARELLNQSPTGSGMGAARDKALNYAGISSKSAEIAARLDPIAGALTNNIPRMQGPQSDGDREEYKTQAGRVADRTLPPSQRLAALDEVERIQKKYASLNGGTADGGDKPAEEKPKQFPSLPAANVSKGKTFRNTETGKLMTSDGMMWKEQ